MFTKVEIKKTTKKQADDNLLVNRIILKEPTCFGTRARLTISGDETIDISAEAFCIKRTTN